MHSNRRTRARCFWRHQGFPGSPSWGASLSLLASSKNLDTLCGTLPRPTLLASDCNRLDSLGFKIQDWTGQKILNPHWEPWILNPGVGFNKLSLQSWIFSVEPQSLRLECLQSFASPPWENLPQVGRSDLTPMYRVSTFGHFPKPEKGSENTVHY